MSTPFNAAAAYGNVSRLISDPATSETPTPITGPDAGADFGQMLTEHLDGIVTTGQSSGASGETFRVESGPGTAQTMPSSTPVAAGGIDALLVLQAVENSPAGRRKATQRANPLRASEWVSEVA